MNPLRWLVAVFMLTAACGSSTPKPADTGMCKVEPTPCADAGAH